MMLMRTTQKLLPFMLWAISGVVCAQPISQTMLRLPDTGETASFTATFGEDHDYLIHVPSFTLNEDGTVTDAVTGLVWQQSDGGEMTYPQAQMYADTLTLGGYTDWRLPSAIEAFSILNHQYSNPALDVSVFSATAAEYWWTSQTQVNNTQKAWATNSGGGIGNHPINETISAGGNKRFHTRVVRDAITPQIIPARFTNNGDGTVTDALTGLIWQANSFADSLTWEDALQYAESLNLAGFTDWRLPNIKELQSLSLAEISNPSIDPTYFNAGGVQRFWSSTSLPNQPSKAWYLQSQFGITTYALKTARNKLFCVRGGDSVITHISETESRSKVYPNPCSSFFIIADAQAHETFQLFDVTGKPCLYGEADKPISTEMLAPGMYFLKRSTRNERTFIIIHF